MNKENQKATGKHDEIGNRNSNHEKEEVEHDPNNPPPMQREWIVHGNSTMNDEEYNLFVSRTTEHLINYRNDHDDEEEEEEEAAAAAAAHDDPNNPPPMHREWIVHGNRPMNDEEYNLFVERTTEHLLTYRNDEIYNEEEEEDLTSYPFLAATVADDMSTVRTLLEQGAIDINATACLGRTAMWYAAYQGHKEILQLLVEHEGDMEKADTTHDRSPLIMACNEGHLEAVLYLLQQGANRDATSNSGWTPLHSAVVNDHLGVATLLMVYGANLNARNDDGDLPIDYAGSEEMRQAIRDEPRRRMDHGHKRATEPKVDDEEEVSNQQPDGEEEMEGMGEVADEDQDSEPSDDEDDRK